MFSQIFLGESFHDLGKLEYYHILTKHLFGALGPGGRPSTRNLLGLTSSPLKADGWFRWSIFLGASKQRQFSGADNLLLVSGRVSLKQTCPMKISLPKRNVFSQAPSFQGQTVNFRECKHLDVQTLRNSSLFVSSLPPLWKNPRTPSDSMSEELTELVSFESNVIESLNWSRSPPKKTPKNRGFSMIRMKWASFPEGGRVGIGVIIGWFTPWTISIWNPK